MLRAVLLDVGGTLWPDQLTPHVDPDPCLQQLRRLLPEVDPGRALATLREEIQCGLAEADRTGTAVQDMHALVRRALRALGICPSGLDTTALRRAVCAPAVPGVQLFPGAAELLRCLRAYRLRCVVVSNVQVRGAVEYWRDFIDLGIAHLVDVVVTSLDVGFRKPHPAFFEAALREAGCAPAACVMVGNSEANDVRPAIALGMRAIRVAIEEPPPAASAAHAIATSLEAVLGCVQQWMAPAPDPRAPTN